MRVILLVTLLNVPFWLVTLGIAAYLIATGQHPAF